MKKNKSRAMFSYYFKVTKSHQCLVINDIGGPRDMSVTNDIENVIDDIMESTQRNPHDLVIVYEDSTGAWDGYNWFAKKFELLDANSADEAIDKYIKKVYHSY